MILRIFKNKLHDLKSRWNSVSFIQFFSMWSLIFFNKKWTKTNENAFKKIKNKTMNQINTYRRMKRWNVCSEVTFKCIDTIMSNWHFVFFFALSSRLGRQVLGAQNQPSISKTASIIITLLVENAFRQSDCRITKSTISQEHLGESAWFLHADID